MTLAELVVALKQVGINIGSSSVTEAISVYVRSYAYIILTVRTFRMDPLIKLDIPRRPPLPPALGRLVVSLPETFPADSVCAWII